MPIYVYECPACFNIEEVIRPLAERDEPFACQCGTLLNRKITAGTFRMPGGNSKINYADAFTADVMGMRYQDVPDNLKAGRKE